VRYHAALLLAVTAATLSAPAAAKDARTTYFSGLAEQEARLAAIAYRLTTANAGWCPQTTPQPGWILGDLRRFKTSDRPAAGGIYGTSDGPFIAAVAPGSPAESAGLLRGTRIAAINGKAVPASGDEPTIRIDEIIVALYDLDPASAWAATDAEGRVHSLAAAPGCASAFRIEFTGAQAAANGILVRVTLKLAQSVADDDELAAVVAHELAHNILRHRERLAGDRPAARVRQTEFEADRLSVWLMAGAGYDPAAAIRFWNRHKRPLIRDASHPPRSERIAAIEAEMATMQTARTADPAARPPLVISPPPLE
jgi:hypothetical protein